MGWGQVNDAIERRRERYRQIVARDRGEVFVLRHGDEEVWQVLWDGRVCSPTWRQRGPAEAYLAALRAGTRKPELSAAK